MTNTTKLLGISAMKTTTKKVRQRDHTEEAGESKTMSSVYKINKGINKPIEFKGLKAQYIAYLGAGLIALLIIFAILYIAGVNMFACLAFIGTLGVALFMTVY